MNYTEKTSPTSEENHDAEVKHFANRVNWRRKMSPAEKAELATRIRNYPNGNGAPIPPNR